MHQNPAEGLLGRGQMGSARAGIQSAWTGHLDQVLRGGGVARPGAF